MELAAALKALVLGVLEGFTEYLPVSSTGHLLLAEHFLGLNFADEQFDKTFAVLIQLGSIMALLLVYFRRLLKIALALPIQPAGPQFRAGRPHRLPAGGRHRRRAARLHQGRACSTR